MKFNFDFFKVEWPDSRDAASKAESLAYHLPRFWLIRADDVDLLVKIRLPARQKLPCSSGPQISSSACGENLQWILQ